MAPETDWNATEDALGNAGRIPGLLRALGDDDAGARAAARLELSARVWCGGLLTPASAAAVPYLISLGADPTYDDRAELLLLARRILEPLSEGMEAAMFRSSFGRLDFARWKQRHEHSTGEYIEEARRLAQEQEAHVLDALRDPDETVRVQAACLLPVVRTAGAARALFEALESEKSEVVLLALLFGASFCGDTGDALARMTGSEFPEGVRLSAAAAILWQKGTEAPPSARDLLLASDDRAGMIVDWLSRVPVEPEIFMRFLDGVLDPEGSDEESGENEEEDGEGEADLDAGPLGAWLEPLQRHCEAELKSLFPRGAPGSSGALSAEQRACLERLHLCEAVWRGPRELEQALRDCGLPDSQSRLATWIFPHEGQNGP